MSFDGTVIKSLIYELNTFILNGKIDKVYQPEKDEMIINIRQKGKNYKLLMSASSNNPRIHLTKSNKVNPMSPPMFCMLLRKHLQGGRITSIKQPDFERIIIIEIESLDDLGVMKKQNLIIEVMGRHSNIILVDQQSNKIIDSIKRVTPDISSIRTVLPGLTYSLPPSQSKLNPLQVPEDIFCKTFEQAPSGEKAYKFLYKKFMGISPLIGREVLTRANLDHSTSIDELNPSTLEALYMSFKAIMDTLQDNTYTPTMVTDELLNKVVAFSAIDISQYPEFTKTFLPYTSDVLEAYYYKRDQLDRIKQKSMDLRKTISTKLDRNYHKLSKQKQERLTAEKREKYKIFGDLITANIYRLTKGDTLLECTNYYSEEGEMISIELNPRLTPSQNAQKYYKRYNKLKNAYTIVSEQIIKTEEDINYLEHILLSIDNASDLTDLEEIREELVQEGYLKKRKRKGHKQKSRKTATSRPKHFKSSDQLDIYVGKNNKQNDYLTLKFANKNDIWLHTKDIPGSHVIIKAQGNNIPDSTITEAALLAAYHSKAALSGNVPVDYTERKNVRKPSGSKPGMVIYDNNHTIFVTPDKKAIEQIERVED